MDSKLTVGGSGNISIQNQLLVLTHTQPGDVKWEVKPRHSTNVTLEQVFGLQQAIIDHTSQSGQPLADVTSFKSLTSNVHINGYKWRAGAQCRYRLPTDNRSDARYRIGVLQFCIVVPTLDNTDFLIAGVCESHLHDRTAGLNFPVVDVSRPRSPIKLFALAHIESLVMFADHWDLPVRHLKVVLHVASTRI